MVTAKRAAQRRAEKAAQREKSKKIIETRKRIVRWSQPSVGGGGSGGRIAAPVKATAPPQMTREEQNKVFEDFQSGRISQSEAVGKISGTSAQAEFNKRVSVEQQRQAQVKRQQTASQQYREKRIIPEQKVVRDMYFKTSPNIVYSGGFGAAPSRQDSFISGFQSPTIDRTGQTYMGSEGYYIKPSYGMGAGGTGIIGLPTYEEKIKIETAVGRGDIRNIFGTTKEGLQWYEEAVVKPLSKSKPFKYYEKNIVEPTSKFIYGPGKEALKWYESTVVKPLSESKPFKFYEKKVVVPISKAPALYKEKVVVPLRKAVPSLGETPIGQIAQAKRIIETKKPGETVRIGLPGQIREVDVSKYKDVGLFGFGKRVYFGEVEKAFTDIGGSSEYMKTLTVSPELFGKGVAITSELGSYAIPGVFVGETALKIGEASIGGPFGGPSSTLEYIKENPFEVALAGAVGIAGIRTALKGQKLKKIKELTKAPEKKIVILESKISKEVVRPDIIKPRVEFSRIKEVNIFEIKPKVKGRILSTEYIQEPGRIGTISELRKIGKGPAKLYKGTAELSSKGFYVEKIKFGDITKVTGITREGKGTLDLFRKGKKIFTKEFDDISQPTFKYKKPSIEKFKVDKQSSVQGLTIEELSIGHGGKTSKIKKITSSEGDIIISDIEPKLGAKLVKSKFETQKLFGEDISAGIQQRVQRTRGFIDIIEVGERKGMMKIKTLTGGKILKKRVGQKIEFGFDKTFDKTLYSGIDKEHKLLKIITPRIKRDITEISGERIITRFKEPNIKVLKGFAKESKKISRDIKMIDRVEKRLEIDESIKQLTETKLLKGKARRETIINKISDIGMKFKKTPSKSYKPSAPQISEYIYGGKLGPQLDLAKVTYVPETSFYLNVKAFQQFKPVPFITGISVPTMVSTGLRPASAIGVLFSKVSMDKQLMDIKSEPVSVQLSEQIQYQLLEPETKFENVNKQLQNQYQKLIQKQINLQLQGQIPMQNVGYTSYSLFGRTGIKPKPKLGIGILIPSFSGKSVTSQMKKSQGYIPQAKTKGGKWIILSKNPMSRSAALSRAARATDNTTSAQFKIKKSSKKMKVEPSMDNYFNVTQRKYRPYRIKKGKKIKLVNQFIEKRDRRIDTRGERYGLKLAKYVKQQNWLAPMNKKSKKKRVINKNHWLF